MQPLHNLGSFNARAPIVITYDRRESLECTVKRAVLSFTKSIELKRDVSPRRSLGKIIVNVDVNVSSEP